MNRPVILDVATENHLADWLLAQYPNDDDAAHVTRAIFAYLAPMDDDERAHELDRGWTKVAEAALAVTS